MSRALAVFHGRFGRATLYKLDRDMATHAHREGHLIFYVAGRWSSLTIDGKPHALMPELAAAISPWRPHSFHAGDPEDGSVFLILYVRPEWFLQMARSAYCGMRFGRSVIEMTPSVTRLASRVTRLLLEGVDPLGAADCDLFDGYLYELTQESFDQSWQWTGDEGMVGLPAHAVRDFRIRNSIKLMKSRLGDGESILLDRIARQAGLSRPHFFKLFKESLGLTPNIYLNTLRMEVAIDKLTTSRDAVTSIGLDLGFSSQASFTRFFASNVGIPPSDYRRAAHLMAA
jgi:AraC-like DNA-binding protein